MGPKFLNGFLEEKAASQASSEGTSPKAPVDTVTVPPPMLRRKRPDHRAEMLLKHLPTNEKEMDRYVEKFCNKYNR